jgi:ferredoxin
VSLTTIRASIAQAGLAFRGAFHPAAEDCVPGDPGTLILLGCAGDVGWPAFAASAEARDGAADPLDRWSRRVIDALAARLGGAPLYPFGGPPWLPFQAWARRAEPVAPSPLGLLIHPRWGLWHSYRGAIALAARIALPPPESVPSPCTRCVGRPCLGACPVGAFTERGYDLAACADHLALPEGRACMMLGCAARRACPIGAAYRHGPARAAFHMRAFRAARTSASTPSQSPGRA